MFPPGLPIVLTFKLFSIFAFNEVEPNVEESDLEVGDSVWIGFQSYDYAAGNGMYNLVFAYHVSRTID